MLCNIKASQQIAQAPSVGIAGIIDMYVNVAAHYHWARMSDEQFQH